MTEQRWMRDFGEFLGDVLEERRISRGVLGKAIGVDRSTISRYISGEIMPSLKNFYNICFALDIDPRDILSCDEFMR